MSQTPVTAPSRSFFYTVAVALFVYGWVSVNIYLPVLPQLEKVLEIGRSTASLTVTVFLVGFSVTQFVWGPLSDRFGRKPVLLCGLAISVTGAVLTAFANSIEFFITARILESVGIGVAPVLARSVLTDSLDRDHVSTAMAYMAVVVALVPAVAPIIGGYLNLLWSWRSIFIFVAAYGAVLVMICAFRLPETIRSRNVGLKPAVVLGEYREMLSHREYLGYIGSYAIAFGTLIGYYAAAPYIFVKALGYTPHEYGYLLLVNVGFYVLGAYVARILVPKVGTVRPIVFAMIAFAITSIIFIALELFTTLSALSVLLPMCIFIFGSGLVSPAANTGAMTLFRDKAGASTAVVGFSIAVGGAVFSGALSAFHITRLVELGTYIGVSTLLSIATYVTCLRKQSG
ncbi:MAG: multidrug effflux MFS transporter, partial [Acidiferrobacterales bacterium]|nr:multidrug effflux MFS transporter [Acidiferrobacterales bacterium]